MNIWWSKENNTISRINHSEDVAPKKANWRVIGLSLLVLSSLGQLYGNIAVVRVAGFAVTIPLLLLLVAAIVGAINFLPRRSTYNGILLVWILLIMWQLLAGVLLGWISEKEWLRSASLFFFNLTCFMLASYIRVDRETIIKATPILVWSMLVFGIIGVAQFLLLNLLEVKAVVPEMIATSQWEPAIDIYRTGGLQRAAGLSLEPSMYAQGLTLALTIYFFFRQISPFEHKRLLWLAIGAVFAGLIVSFSVSGIAMAIAVILIVGLTGGLFRLNIRLIFLLVFALLLGIIVYHQNWFPSFTDRIREIVSGNDSSSNLRVVAALYLFFLPPIDFADFVVGQGLGMESNYRSLMQIVYGKLFGYYETNIHNIFSVIKITQGWMGIALHLVVLLAIFRPFSIKKWSLYTPLLTVILFLHFASGYYLHPAFWAILALAAVLRSADIEVG